ncbi:WD40 repeat-like protein [Macrolepiota fuliginosa MF-IS2]|uniref:WD40 repeat-like protein n=1 Tax=Macrolepiota fuliginosa MF-IS2 TaxID=1400762 RepID=A0A9P5X6J4_9AGAR|nr:WD40 repeat-like protein [Macrolepiota fuliginosa MF-IS2]
METPPIRITADEINCLIYSYFKDSGFNHSAFALCTEGGLQKSAWFSKHIPRGELVDLLSKALLYLEVESHWRGDAMTTNCKNKFSLLEHHICSSDPSSSTVLKSPAISSVTSRSLPIPKPTADKTLPSEQGVSTPRDSQVRPISSETFYSTAPTPQMNGTLTPGEPTTKRKVSPIQIDGPAEKRAKREPDDMEVEASIQNTDNTRSTYDNGTDVLKRARTRINQGPLDDTTDPKAIMMLPGHRTEVFVCAFNPTKHTQLATGSKDAVVNLWSLPEPPASKDEFATWNGNPITINNYQKDVQGDLTALNWNPEGTLLAIGSYDSVLRILTSEGGAHFTHNQHRGPIFSVRFSQNGRWLLSASLDETTCLWDVKEKRLIRQYRCHQDCCLDAEWLDDTTFVTGGADGNIYVMKTDSPEPIKKFSGHTDEINQLKCNPSRTRLASCSDDNTTRIWKTDKIEADSDEIIPGLAASDQMVVLTGHTHSVSVIGWMPAHKPGTNELMATSSFDGTVRVWDTVAGKCTKILTDHKRPVYALAFSPDGKWLATGSGDGWLLIYWVKTWEKRWSWYAGHDKPGVFEIAWQMESGVNRLAVALECRQVAIIDASRIPALWDVEEAVNGAAQAVV